MLDTSKEELRILVVEDESIVARDIQNILCSLGFVNAEIAFSGQEAVDKAKKMEPHLVLMDIKLREDMDGIESARRIQSFFAVPIIYLSALADENTIKRAKTTKPFFFISKPIMEFELERVLEEAISGLEKHN